MHQRRPHETIGPWINAEVVLAVVETVWAFGACFAIFWIPLMQVSR